MRSFHLGGGVNSLTKSEVKSCLGTIFISGEGEGVNHPTESVVTKVCSSTIWPFILFHKMCEAIITNFAGMTVWLFPMLISPLSEAS